MIKKVKKTLSLGGKELILETGLLAPRANASVLATLGETVVLATIVASAPREDLDYFPLQVEYMERLYAGGKIKGSRWVKREGKPLDSEVLTGRMIDRSLRPLFPAGLKNDTQIILTVLSTDHDNNPDVVALIAASALVHISDVPWNGPIAGLRVGMIDGKYLINPSQEELARSDLDLIVSVGKDGVVMLDGQADQVPEDKFFGAIEFAQKQAQPIIKLIDELQAEVGLKKMPTPVIEKEKIEKVKKLAQDKIIKLVDVLYEGKEQEYFDQVQVLIDEVKGEIEGVEASIVADIIEKELKLEIKKRLFAGKRPDGRGLEDVRSLSIAVDLLPRVHGSALFQRGQTQVMTIATLGPPSLSQLIESVDGEETKRYIHHYNMPPFSVGETGRIGSPGRREIGHGALAEKALLPVLPTESEFPYTIRLVSEVFSSNGSTSMASTCASTLVLMAAGVPIKDMVAGIAIGLVCKKDKYTLLTDMRGVEDFNGEMDFKVTGTKTGITAVQVDIKNSGLSLALVKDAIARAQKARMFILDKMREVIAEPRKQLSEYAPKVGIVNIPIDSIGALIGPGGKTIRKIMEDANCEIDVDNSGAVTISADDKQSLDKAMEIVDAMTRKVEPGEIFQGEVTRVEPFGAFIEFLPGKEGLVHVSRMGTGFIKSAADHLSVGQQVEVKLNEIDDQGRYNLSLLSPKIEGGSRPDNNFAPRHQQDGRSNARRYKKRF